MKKLAEQDDPHALRMPARWLNLDRIKMRAAMTAKIYGWRGTLIEFDPYSYAIHDDPYPVYRRLREEMPLYFNEKYGFWIVSRFDDCKLALKNFKIFSNASGTQLEDRDGFSDVLTTDPPDHTRLRHIMSPLFQPTMIARLEPMVREGARMLLARCAETGRMDVIADFAGRLPMLVISRMLGHPPEDDDMLQNWTNTAVHRDEGVQRMPPAGLAAMENIGRYNEEALRRRAAGPLGDDLVSPLIVAMNEGRLSHAEAMGYMQILSFAGHETTTKLIGNMIYQLFNHPAQRQWLLDDPALIPAAIEETVRFDTSVQLQARTVTRDFDLHGRTIPTGSKVGVLFGSANRDERKYDQAETYDIRRHPRDHIGFGFGLHSCLGAPLARLEARVAMEELLALMPAYEIDQSGLKRMHSPNVRGYSHLPVTFAPSTALAEAAHA